MIARESFNKNLTSLLYDQPSPGSEMRPQLKDRGSDNALSVQGYRTTQGAMIDEHGSVLE